LQHFSQFDRLARIPRIKIVDPVGYLDFLCLLSTCSLALTDSGGVQEEACILKVPCVTLRDNTERPETVTVGANLIAGMDPKAVKKAVSRMLNRRRSWRNPFGDGKSSQRIIAELHKIAQSRISTSEG
jgi:UDP-N-acetylglucosamine 2-epimerase (non-hydrolysing)